MEKLLAFAFCWLCLLGAVPPDSAAPSARVTPPLQGLALGPVGSTIVNIPEAPGKAVPQRLGATSEPMLSSGEMLSVAFLLGNQDSLAATELRVTSLAIVEGSASAPLRIVRAPSTLGPNAIANAFAELPLNASSVVVQPGKTFTLSIGGDYTVQGTNHHFALQREFRIPPAAPGSATATATQAPFETIVAARPVGRVAPQRDITDVQPNIWTVPLGVPRPLTRTQQPVIIKPAPPPLVDPPVEIFNSSSVSGAGSTVNEPSGAISTASGGGVIFATFNWGAAFSTNNGASWTSVNASDLGNADGGFCCDQVVQFVPGINLFVWVMQTMQPPNGPNRERILVASPATIVSTAGTAWRRIDITPALLQRGSQDLFDYPDLAVGDHSLYLSFDDVSGFFGSFGWASGQGLEVVRIPVSQLATNNPNVDLSFTNANDSQMATLGHLAQTPGNAIFWAGHNSNSSIRVFSWPEASNVYSWHDVDVGSWSNDVEGLSAVTPDNQDWLSKLRTLGFPIAGLTRLMPGPNAPQDLLFLAWTAARGDGFAQPQVQWVALSHSQDFNAWNLSSQQQIFDPSHSVALPALASNLANEVGISAEVGGNGTFENHAIGFLTDLTLLTTTSSDTGTSRFGDYTTIRPDPNSTTNFDALGYGVNGGAATTRLVVFGRPLAAGAAFNRISIRLDTGNDNAGSGVEIFGAISGQPHSICLKPSSDLPADDVCPNHPGATDENGKQSWENGTSSTQTFPLATPVSATSAFGTLTITLRQAGCSLGCDNWDIQKISVSASDSTGHLPTKSLLNLGVPLDGDNCLARLRGPPNATTARFGLDGSQSHIFVDGPLGEQGSVTSCPQH